MNPSHLQFYVLYFFLSIGQANLDVTDAVRYRVPAVSSVSGHWLQMIQRGLLITLLMIWCVAHNQSSHLPDLNPSIWHEHVTGHITVPVCVLQFWRFRISYQLITSWLYPDLSTMSSYRSTWDKEGNLSLLAALLQHLTMEQFWSLSGSLSCAECKQRRWNRMGNNMKLKHLFTETTKQHQTTSSASELLPQVPPSLMVTLSLPTKMWNRKRTV
jgi:hypothetical protein